MKIYLAQFNPIVGDLEGNAKKILEIAIDAFNSSADLVLTPELSLWGYPPKDLLFNKNLIKKQDKILNKLSSDIANKFGNLSIIIGMAETRAQYTFSINFCLKSEVKIFAALAFLASNNTPEVSLSSL